MAIYQQYLLLHQAIVQEIPLVFFQAGDTVDSWTRAKRSGQAAQLNTEHLMASSAIPVVFPSVKIKNQHFGDGSVHQLSPLSPAIHLGAERVFVVVGVEQPKKNQPRLMRITSPPHRYYAVIT